MTFSLYLFHVPLIHVVVALAPWPADTWPTRALVFFGVPLMVAGASGGDGAAQGGVAARDSGAADARRHRQGGGVGAQPARVMKPGPAAASGVLLEGDALRVAQ